LQQILLLTGPAHGAAIREYDVRTYLKNIQFG
jgi:hypothetical protein